MRIDSVRCEVTDLLADQCAHCKHSPGGGARPVLTMIDETLRSACESPTAARPTVTPTFRDRTHNLPPITGPMFAAPAGDDRDQFGAIFPASYPGQCAGCADRIDEGDAIRHSTPHGGYIHEGCEDE